MARILVTGAAGFIGSWVAEGLVKAGHAVLGVDDLSGGEIENTNCWLGPVQAQLVLLDLRDPVGTARVFESFRPDVVHHLAAHPHEGLSQFSPHDIFTTTAVTSINVFREAVRVGVKRVVFYSSMARYGHGGFQPPFSEDYPRAPVDVYGAAKVASEVALEALHEAHGLDYTIIAPRNVSGPRQARHDPCRNVLAIWINQCLRGKDIYIYGDGEQRRSFSDIRDSLPCYLRATDDPGVSREVINVGSQDVRSINEAADVVLARFPGRAKIHVDPRPCEVVDAYCTSSKASRLLGFEHRHDLESLIDSMVSWMRSVGPKEPIYPPLELEHNAPRTWRERLI